MTTLTPHPILTKSRDCFSNENVMQYPLIDVMPFGLPSVQFMCPSSLEWPSSVTALSTFSYYLTKNTCLLDAHFPLGISPHSAPALRLIDYELGSKKDFELDHWTRKPLSSAEETCAIEVYHRILSIAL